MIGLLAVHDSGAQPRRDPLAWPAVQRDARPWTRWWWLGSAVDREHIGAELRDLHAAGFGGVEITAIYGVRGAEALSVPYLSPQWVALLRSTITDARQLGMAVDLPQGSGWRMGGPFVPPAEVNASLRVSIDSVRAGETWTIDPAGRRIAAVTGFSGEGAIVDVARAPQTVIRWSAPPGRWALYVAEIRGSGDSVKRPAPGNEGPAIDVFSRPATEHYLRTIADRLMIPRGALRSYFHDSFEYTGDGSTELLESFRRNRGYDLARELPALAGRGDADHVARVKSDYRQTMDEMLLDNFVRPLTAWSHGRGALMREQAHGSPGNLLDLYAATDIPETEIFGPLGGTDADPLVNKFASSAAHVAGRPLASAESFTWMGEHFSATLDEVKHAADLLFVSGINHLIYHGTAYSPPGAAWPGWQFYASSEFNSRNAWWSDLPALNGYVARVQSVLQAGQPSNDVLLYWPVWDSWHDAAGMRMDFRVHAPTWLYGKPVGQVASALWTAGYGFDFVSDRQLATDISVRDGRLRSRGGGYAVIVVPPTAHMPPETLDRLLALARDGATVVFVGHLPGDVPGLSRLVARRARLASSARTLTLSTAGTAGVQRATLRRGQVLVAPTVQVALDVARVHRERLTDMTGVRLIRRRRSDGYDYFVAHHGRDSVGGWVPLAVQAAAVAIMDPLNGRTGLADRRVTDPAETEIRLELAPGESRILRTFDHPVSAPRWSYETAATPPVRLAGVWSVRFLRGGPVLPTAFTSDSSVVWTGRGDEDADRFAGTARYALQFDAPDNARDYVLDLGRVGESARVHVNGRDLGVLFAHPFRVHTGPLEARGNRLEIDVTNLSANRVRDLDRRRVPWKIFHDINYVGIDYKPFDASGWPVRASGLVGPVTLTPVSASAGIGAR
jgi:hypothetical protein